MLPKEQKNEEPISIEFLITKEFLTTEAFSMYIEKEANRRHIGMMESLLEYCDQKDIDPVSIAGIITTSLKQKIQAEAEDLNLLKRMKGKLSL